MAAIDYARLRGRLPRARLLFVAHREGDPRPEPGDISSRSSRHAFGEIWVGGHRPRSSTTSSLRSRASMPRARRLAPTGHFDVVIVDEFHHAAAPSTRACSSTSSRVELLGLTATPERSDGLPVLSGSTTASLPSCAFGTRSTSSGSSPFAYYGIHDGVDLRQVPWRRGRGYDVEGADQRLDGERRLGALGPRTGRRQRVDVLARCERSASASASTTPGSWPGASSDTGSLRRGVGRQPHDERAAALRISPTAHQRACSPSTCSTRASTYRRSTRCCCFARPTARRCSCSSSDDGVASSSPARRSARCSTSSAIIARSSGSTGDSAHYLAEPASDLERAGRAGFPFLPAGCHMRARPGRERGSCCEAIREAIPSRWPEKVEELRS